MDKDNTQKVLEKNQKKIEKILRQNGVDPNNIPPLTVTTEERSVRERQRFCRTTKNALTRL